MWFVSPLALVSLSSCCPSKHALLVPKEEDCIEWFKNAGFKDVKLKRIGPKWYHGGFKVRHGQVHPSVHISAASTPCSASPSDISVDLCTSAFMQHLILYFWNRFEVPALQRFMQNRRSHQQDFHITSSTILASTLHITRLNTRNQGVTNTDSNSGVGFRPGFDPSAPQNSAGVAEPPRRPENNQDTVANPVQIPGQADIRQAEGGPNPGSMNSFSSMLLWILGGASSEGLNSFFSMFRDVRDQGQVFAETPHDENRENQDNDR